ncbi:unnamed protein product [Larinioides sclopetarius]|uniref:Uncharacterized protein n=1 Tax=Larinioides sclopetarius TaxID=280406 RepID=A0AAV2A5A7_9ARAC
MKHHFRYDIGSDMISVPVSYQNRYRYTGL